ncbi:TonB-dependent receptor [Rhodohalobacter sp. SW132]|uniref:SusC/RagA family TonB-linked outer membrane protein n=1 Tax=Rhodohalobacter sp. SW132 TaxID=2293433 RepID=UPI000E23ED9E|nr:TonB-dependent receptor [Rhodohalobacter sp. SW132]REL38065.1 TonB-dependent receptor [Rhodohalobacter sp. SW132]
MNQTLLSKLIMKMLLVIPLLLIGTNGMAQHDVSGTVIDGNTMEPLPGVSILVMGTDQGTASNIDGEFSLSVPDQNSTLVFTYIGYVRQEVPLEGRNEITVELQPSILMGDDVVVVGYGTQRLESLTGSVASVSAEQMAKVPVPTVTHALQGMAPGLQLLDGGDRPGRNQLNLLIRGQGTLGRGDPGSANASRPLVLVDGVEANLANVDINDVERVSVLKDASSAAIYGSRAANGVILVTTKRGAAQGRVQVSYNGYIGMQNITAWPEQVDAETHMRLANVARTNFLNWCLDGRDPNAQTEAACYDNPSYAPRYSEEYIQNTISSNDRDAFPADDHVDAMFNPAPIRDHTLRVSGGNETARYALSLNHMGEDGLMPNTGANRTGVRLNTDFQLTEQISGGVDVSATRRWDTIPAENWGSTFFLIHDTPPTIRTRYTDGTYGLNLFGHSPLAYAEVSGSEDRVFWDGTLTGRFNYQIVPGIVEIQTLASYDYGSMDWERFRTNPALIDDYPSNGTNWGPSFGENRTNTSRQLTLRALADYSYIFDQIHEVSGVVGYEQIEYNFEEFRAWRDQFYNNELRQLNLGNSANDGNSGFGNEWALHSGFTRFNYTLLDRYMFEFNARYDGSSRFAEGNRYGFFPSFSLGWRLSEESFFNVDWVNELKFRGSWGKLGNQDVPLYSYYSSINLGIPYYLGNSGGTQAVGGAATNLVNEDLSWETTTVINFGVDTRFLNDRLSMSAELYTRRTEDILLQLPVPDMVGLDAAYQNAGVVENKGWELSLGWEDVVGDVSYGINLNLSDNRNEVVDLFGTGPYVLGGNLDGHVVQEGSPIGAWYGLEAVGLFNSYEEIDNHAQVAGWETRLGDVIFKDQNGDGIINDEDRVVIGDPNPRYIFGVNLNMGWRNFDMSAFFQGVGKRDQYLGLGFAQGPVWENFTSEWHKDHWTPDNPDARHPAYYSNYNRNYYTTNSWWILDGSFVKLRNLQLGYSLPQTLINRLGIQNVRLYANGKNLWTRHNLGLDLDPEYPWTVGDYYPQTRVISMGANISF